MEEDVDHMPNWIVFLTSLSVLTSITISFVSIYMHLKNYRKPMDQRLIVRIQIMVPLYAVSSWLALHWHNAEVIVDPIREVYEAFVIYTFFTLLTNLLGGERDIIISTSGRPPKKPLPPFNRWLPKIDISDPYTFLTIKRGVLQYTWIKPLLCLMNVICEFLGVYRPNVIAWNSGYFWSGLIYNVSISLSLYSLAQFWACLYEDLTPYRAMPKFLCIKAVIFFSFWQGFAISILKYFGFFISSGHMIQNTLLCFEMLGFAIGHWSAFSYHDYATSSMIGFGRLPVKYAIRDAFGIADLIIDFRSTFYGDSYEYRQFDSVETLLDHPESRSRQARINAGLRYKNGGKSKYWLPRNTSMRQRSPEMDNTSLLNGTADIQRSYGTSGDSTDINGSTRNSNNEAPINIEAPDSTFSDDNLLADEQLYAQARKLQFGDYNYPVITVRESIPYTPIVDQQKAKAQKGNSHASSVLAQEYQSFGPPSDVDEDERIFFENSYKPKRKGKR